jgi:hypothetical protein
LRAFGLAAARPDDLFDRYRLIEQRLFKFRRSIRKVDFQDCQGMRDEFDLIALVQKRFEHA